MAGNQAYSSNFKTAERKYVRFPRGIVTFPNEAVHSDIAEGLEHCMGPVISAGFVKGKKCYGKSISLRKESRPEDSEILRTSIAHLRRRDVETA